MATAAELDAPTNPIETFRQEARDWIAANFPPALKHAGNAMATVEGPTEESADEKAWRTAMGGKGWGVPPGRGNMAAGGSVRPRRAC